MTAQEEATIATGLARRTESVEPFSGYTVVRARREFANQSNIGFMATSTNRQLTESVNFLADDAYTGGVDYDIRLSRRFNFSGYWAGSRISGSPEAITRLQENNVHAFQRPDATHVEVDEHAAGKVVVVRVDLEVVDRLSTRHALQ